MAPTTIAEVPYDEDGNLRHYKDDGASEPVMRPNRPFQAELTLTGMRSGRSAKYLIWTDDDGRTYPMFVTDLMDVIREKGIAPGGRTGKLWWYVRKRGTNYGLALAPPDQVAAEIVRFAEDLGLDISTAGSS